MQPGYDHTHFIAFMDDHLHTRRSLQAYRANRVGLGAI
jgi:hypothetical protein